MFFFFHLGKAKSSTKFVFYDSNNVDILEKCSTVCEVRSGLTPREAGITGQRFIFLKLNSA